MSEVRVNKLSPRSGTTVTLGDSGDTITIPSGVTLANSGTFTNFQSTGIDDNATSTAITINSSGNVGIGISSPDGITNAKILQIHDSSTNWSQLILSNATSGSAQGNGFNLNFNGTDAIINNRENGYVSFRTNDLDRMRIDSSGNVGIGTSTPGTALQVEKDWVSDYGSINISHSTNSLGGLGIRCNGVFKSALIYKGGTSGALLDIGTYNAEPILFRTSNQERMRIDSSGNVGIGDIPENNWASTSDVLQIGTSGALWSGDTANYMYLSSNVVFDNTNFRYINSAEASYYVQNGTGDHIFATAPSGTAGATFSASTRMIIKNAGNVGIGTSSPDSKLRVDDTADQTILAGVNSNASFSSNGVFLQLSRNTTNNSFYAMSYYNAGAGSYKFRVADSGNVTNTNNSYGAISDEKLKENIIDATPKLEKLKQVRIVNFNFINDNQKQIGVIAQELENIFPNMVEETPDKDEDGKDLNTTTKQVKYSVFVPILIKALQEQETKIEQLEARITALETQP